MPWPQLILPTAFQQAEYIGPIPCLACPLHDCPLRSSFCHGTFLLGHCSSEGGWSLAKLLQCHGGLKVGLFSITIVHTPQGLSPITLIFASPASSHSSQQMSLENSLGLCAACSTAQVHRPSRGCPLSKPTPPLAALL